MENLDGKVASVDLSKSCFWTLGLCHESSYRGASNLSAASLGEGFHWVVCCPVGTLFGKIRCGFRPEKGP